ncbi:MAG: polymer-forming cytoskeletal protein [Acidobacteriota bacterium]|nr:polymer-forming cytoskeletal protein [Acidobacteriota bacterium]
MWKRQEHGLPNGHTGSGSPTPRGTPEPNDRPTPAIHGATVNIGQSVVMKGELTGSEDLVIDGQVEGTITLQNHLLTIGPSAKIKANMSAKSVVVVGHAHGNITATDKIEIRENGSVDGDISAPRVTIAEGAHFRGSVDMQTPPPAEPASQKTRGGNPSPTQRR